MAWKFLYSIRREFRGDNNWGEMYMRSADDKKWEWLCYAYELPWKADAVGKSLNKISRVEMGIYELNIRTDGDPLASNYKGWRLELLKTGHRSNVQIHRAAKNMYIEGCILPVHFNSFQGADIKKGDTIIETKSKALMEEIMIRLTNLIMKNKKTSGPPTLTIAETLPAELLTDKSHAHV